MTNLFLGAMSGTSMDGVDVVLADFSSEPLQLIATCHHPYTDSLRDRLLTLSHAPQVSVDTLCCSEVEVGRVYAEAVQSLLSLPEVKAYFARAQCPKIAALGAHGQTIRHCPDAEIAYTCQIGDAATIAALTGIPVVADFRRQDLAAGGQGAPLAPLFHQQFFSHDSKYRVIVNIGGISNITILAPSTEHTPGFPKGYDTGPGNVLLDAWIAQKLNLPFDKDGKLAASGAPIPALLEQAMSEPYFQRPSPKSTGRELFNLPWLMQCHPDLATFTTEDVLATLVEVTTNGISEAIMQEFSHLQEEAIEGIYVCGGGALNQYMLQRLDAKLPWPVATTQALAVPPQWVEGLGFAWLAKQRLLEKRLDLAAITGSNQAQCLGGLYL